MSENDITDIAIRITDMLVELGYVPNCLDTDDEDEFEVQDAINKILTECLQRHS